MSTLRAVWSSMRTQWHNSMARAMMKYILVVSPLVHAALGAFMLKQRGPEGMEYAVVGAALLTLWGATIWSSATDMVRERTMGNLEYLLVAPVPLVWSTLGKNLGNVVLALGATAVSMLYSRFLFGIPVRIAQPGWLALGVAIMLFSFLGLSLALGTLVVFSRQSVSLMNGMDYPIYIIAGVMFPLDLLPDWTRPLSLAMPLTWARDLVGAALTGGSPARFWTAAAWMVGLGLMYGALAVWLFRVVDRKARQKGELFA